MGDAPKSASTAAKTSPHRLIVSTLSRPVEALGRDRSPHLLSLHRPQAGHQAVQAGLQRGGADAPGATSCKPVPACGEGVDGPAQGHELWRIACLAETMEAAFMATVTAQQASLSSLLGALRGEIIDARLGYPGVLHIEISDLDGDRWNFVTQDAEWSPVDPADLVGRMIEGAEVGGEGELRCQLSSGTSFVVVPADQASDDDPPNWELVTPGGVALAFGPGTRWQISGADVARTR
jgi:hypothetical protein